MTDMQPLAILKGIEILHFHLVSLVTVGDHDLNTVLSLEFLWTVGAIDWLRQLGPVTGVCKSKIVMSPAHFTTVEIRDKRWREETESLFEVVLVEG